MPVLETELIVSLEAGEISRRTLRPGEYIIGRDSQAHLYVEADSVSQRHARLRLNPDHATIEDLGSESGTRVNGRPVTGSAVHEMSKPQDSRPARCVPTEHRRSSGELRYTTTRAMARRRTPKNGCTIS